MILNELLKIYEADPKPMTFKPTTDNKRNAGIRVNKDSGDDYSSNNIPSIFGNKWNTKESRGVLNSISAKFAKFFSELADSNDTARPYIEKLKLDDRRKGALGLANLYGRLLNDVLTDTNGNRVATNDEDGFNLIKNRLQTQLGGESSLYPILFRIGRDITLGDTEGAKNGSVNLVRWLSNIADKLGVNDMSEIYKQKDKIDSIDGAKALSYLTRDINDYMENMRDDVKNGKVSDADIIGMPNSEYMNVYYGDEGEGEVDDDVLFQDEITTFKREMAQSLKDSESLPRQKRWKLQDDIVDKWIPNFIDGKNNVKMFANAIIQSSGGTHPAFTDKFLNTISDVHGEQFARDINKMSSKITKTEYEDNPPPKSASNSIALNKSVIDAAVNSATTNDLISSAKKLAALDLSVDDLNYISSALGNRMKNGPDITRSKGRGSGKEYPFKGQQDWDFKQAMQFDKKLAQANKNNESTAISYVDSFF